MVYLSTVPVARNTMYMTETEFNDGRKSAIFLFDQVDIKGISLNETTHFVS